MPKNNSADYGGIEIFTEEAEVKPNTYAFNVLLSIMFIIMLTCILNALHVFEISTELLCFCLFVTIVLCIITGIIVKDKKKVRDPLSKYIIFSIALFLVLNLTVILNINAVLAFTLPLLLAAQYKSMTISRIALIGSCLCCLVSPILSYLLGTWNLNFLTGYIQVFCDVTISSVPGSGISVLESIGRIILYWAMPQTMTIGAFGIILYSSTRNGIKSVHNQIQVAELSGDLSRQTESIATMREKVLFSMSDIIESRDIETGGHVRRTSEVMKILMNAMKQDPSSGVAEVYCSRVVNSAPMHDLGKIAIPDTILRKKGKLTHDEFEIVKRHPIKSAQIIAQALTGVEDDKLLEIAINIAKYHHERFDGTGYPEHLIGKDIPLEARIMAIVDVYDALVSPRYYKEPVPFDEAYNIIEDSMGKQFDPDLNKYFNSCRSEIEKFYSSDNTVFGGAIA